MPRMTLTNESIVFSDAGIWIQPLLSRGFYFNGSAVELLSILIYHKEIDIDVATFRVRKANETPETV